MTRYTCHLLYVRTVTYLFVFYKCFQLVKKNTAGNHLLLLEIPTKFILLLKKILDLINLSSQKGRMGEKNTKIYLWKITKTNTIIRLRI